MVEKGKMNKTSLPEQSPAHVGIDSPLSSPIAPDDQREVIHDNQYVRLSWRTWLVVFITCFAYVSSSVLQALYSVRSGHQL